MNAPLRIDVAAIGARSTMAVNSRRRAKLHREPSSGSGTGDFFPCSSNRMVCTSRFITMIVPWPFSMAVDDGYPGERATPYDLNRLADFYRDAAHRAAGSIQLGDPMSAAPLRLLAIQSIELNLSAYLLLHGSSSLAVRKMGHDLATRLDHAKNFGLVLRQRTSAHVAAVARDREYLIARYGPDCLTNASKLNRMLATMEEVATKVSQAISAANRAFNLPTEADSRPNAIIARVQIPERREPALSRPLGRNG